MSECDINCSFKEAREEIVSLKDAWAELQEKYEALEDGANNAYGLYREYKDAEEQGLLIKLPCKAGDTVFLNQGEDFDSGYDTGEVESVNIVKGGIVEIVLKVNEDVEVFNIEDIGREIFFDEALKGSV